MKKGLFFLAMLLSLSIILSSCGAKDANPTCSDGIQNGNETSIDCGGSDCPSCCVICGEYQGLANGTFVVPAESINETVVNQTMAFNVLGFADNTYEIQFYFFTPSSFGSPMFNAMIEGELNGNTLTVTNEVIGYNTTVGIINGTCTFNSTFDEITGSFDFSAGTSGSVTIFGEM